MSNAVLSTVCVATVGIERLALVQAAQQAAPKVKVGSPRIAKTSTTTLTIDRSDQAGVSSMFMRASAPPRRFDAMPRGAEALPRSRYRRD